MTIIQTDQDRFLAAHELYKQAYGEVVHYRDMEWKIVTMTVALFAAIVALAPSLPSSIPTVKIVLKVLLVVFILVATAYSSWHLHFVHNELTNSRILRRRLEELFGFFDAGLFKENESLLPPSWKGVKPKYSQGQPHLVSWWLLIVLVAIYACTSIVMA